jgi:hypothetical protein
LKATTRSGSLYSPEIMLLTIVARSARQDPALAR